MNKLTKDEIKLYIKSEDEETGVKAITEDYLRKINLDEVPEISLPEMLIDGACISDLMGKPLYKYDSFTPIGNSHYFKPSFAGTQVLMGRVGRKLYFSNGRWFMIE